MSENESEAARPEDMLSGLSKVALGIWGARTAAAVALPLAALGGFFVLMMSGKPTGEMDALAFWQMFIISLSVLWLLAGGYILGCVDIFRHRHGVLPGKAELDQIGFRASWLVPGAIVLLIGIPTLIGGGIVILVIGAVLVFVTVLLTAGVSRLVFWMLDRNGGAVG